MQDSQLGPNSCPLLRGSTVYRTAIWVPIVSSIERIHCIQDSQLGPRGGLYNREVPLYTCKTASWIPTVSSIERFNCIQDSQLGPMVSSIERFHCTPDSQLGPKGGLYREVPLYTGQPTGSQWCPL